MRLSDGLKLDEEKVTWEQLHYACVQQSAWV